MGGIWQSLKQKLSRRHLDRNSKNLDPKPASNGGALQSKQPKMETDSTSVAGQDGEHQQEVHRPDAEGGRVDENQNFQSGEQAVEAGMSGFYLTNDYFFQLSSIVCYDF